jgi:hypothetical protein
MRKFNEKDFDIREVIKKRVNLESEIEYAKKTKSFKPVRIKLSKPKKNSVWWWNFTKTMLRELNP